MKKGINTVWNNLDKSDENLIFILDREDGLIGGKIRISEIDSRTGRYIEITNKILDNQYEIEYYERNIAEENALEILFKDFDFYAYKVFKTKKDESDIDMVNIIVGELIKKMMK